MLVTIPSWLLAQRASSITEINSSNGFESRQVTIIIHNSVCKLRLQWGNSFRKQRILRRHCRIERLRVGVIRYNKLSFTEMPIIAWNSECHYYSQVKQHHAEWGLKSEMSGYTNRVSLCTYRIHLHGPKKNTHYLEKEIKTKTNHGSKQLGDILHRCRKGDVNASQMGMSELCGTYRPLL